MGAPLVSPELVLVAPPEEASRLRSLLPDGPTWPAAADVRPLTPPLRPWPRRRQRALLLFGIVNAVGSLALSVVHAA